MGMYSEFIDEEITVTDKEALLEYAQDNEDIKELLQEDDVSFLGWDDSKLYGYFYDSTTDALDKVAECVEGYAEFHYEDGTLFRLVFRGGDWSVLSSPPVNWEEAEVTTSEQIKKGGNA